MLNLRRLKLPKCPITPIKYHYLTPIDKPTYSIAMLTFQQLSVQLMQYPYIETLGAICPQISVMCGAFLAKIGIQLICATIRNMKYSTEKQMHKINYANILSANQGQVLNKINNQRFVMKWIHKIFIIDSIRDYKFHNFTDEKINDDIRMYYRPGAIFASAVNIYLSLNVLRGSHLLITSPQHAQFCASTVYIPNLMVHDPSFITPVLTIPVLFLILRYSKHPLMVNINQKLNLLHCLNIACMAGLALVPTPGIYHFSVFGLLLGHLLSKSLVRKIIQLKKMSKNMINFYKK